MGLHLTLDNRHEMLKSCDDLIKGHVTREDTLEHTEVDSTDSPPKKLKVAPKAFVNLS